MLWKRTILLILSFINLIWKGNSQVISVVNWIHSFLELAEKLPYSLLRKIQDNVEEREYSSRKWICTEEFSTPERFDEKHRRMIRTLNSYRQQQSLPITYPLSTKVDHRNGALYSYEACFHVPPEIQLLVPTKLQEKHRKVKILTRPKLRVFSLEFGGYATPLQFQQKFNDLSNILKNQNLTFAEQEIGSRALHFINVFSFPSEYWNRRNEIWLLVENPLQKLIN